jgi:hypothetical protein
MDLRLRLGCERTVVVWCIVAQFAERLYTAVTLGIRCSAHSWWTGEQCSGAKQYSCRT